MCCQKCGKGLSFVLLLLGLLYLIADLSTWDFWGIQWYTVGFLLAGFAMWGCSCCADCQNSCCGGCDVKAPAAKKKQ